MEPGREDLQTVPGRVFLGWLGGSLVPWVVYRPPCSSWDPPTLPGSVNKDLPGARVGMPGQIDEDLPGARESMPGQSMKTCQGLRRARTVNKDLPGAKGSQDCQELSIKTCQGLGAQTREALWAELSPS